MAGGRLQAHGILVTNHHQSAVIPLDVSASMWGVYQSNSCKVPRVFQGSPDFEQPSELPDPKAVGRGAFENCKFR